MTAPAPFPDGTVHVPAELKDAVLGTRAELARIDGKAAALMGWSATFVAIVIAAASIAAGAKTLPSAWAMTAVLLGAVLLAAAVAVLLGVIRPALRPKSGRFGFMAHAAAGDTAQVLAVFTADPTPRLVEEVVGLAVLAATKYRRLRVAVDLLRAALAVLVTALPLGMWT